LVTDVVMPQMNGPELAQQVTALRPETKVLYMSGHANDALARVRALGQNVAYIQKPFALDRLAQKLREVLMGKPTGVPPLPPSGE
jgi:DNA-binding NtrC family response regulator